MIGFKLSFRVGLVLISTLFGTPVSKSSMAESRHFPNPYPPTLQGERAKILDDSKNQLSEEYVANSRRTVQNLLKVLDAEEKRSLDWGDVSVYTGVSGYVLLYLHLTDVLEDDRYIQKALPLIEKAITKIKGRRVAFVCGDPGPLTLGAILYHRLNMTSQVPACIEGVKKLKKDILNPKSDVPDEILYGRAGYLYALLLIQQKIGKAEIDDTLVRSVVSAILDSGRALSLKEKRSVPLMYQWHEKHYIGAAHGIIGILFMLLQAKEHLTSAELNELVKPTIDYVAKLQFPSGNLPSSLSNESDRLIHWCHGAPGAVFLFAKAYQVFNERSYLEHALKAGESIWERGLLKKGYGLCHGSSGNGYALLYLYQVTGDSEMLYRAAQFGHWCQDYGKHGCRTPDRPMSLFEGLAGNIHFLADIAKPKNAKFPAFVL
ncbi:lanC-like protein 2 isoform X1 [Penaeus chinensis]|uniref:lanC-like protein 2 isoform X1 n=2 Tax=Penaeus chinensis TaxID=139456 RepID=UPI001FB80703|nr:lanC-like protein 2 isoform X1 [Penaeus chinensis]